MKRSEAETDIRAIKRTCRGPHAYTAEQQKQFVEAFINVDTEEGLAEVLKVLGLTDAGTAPTVRDKVFSLIYRRVGCGYDVNELILSQPLDGLTHSAPCLKCGDTKTWVPASYTIESE